MQESGIEKENIVAIPLNEIIKEQPKIVLGASFGFVLKWGPIIWGLIGLALGAICGFLIDYFMTKKRIKIKSHSITDVVLIIKCQENQFQTVKNILLEYMTLGIGKLRI